jgi:hypothetical protein
MKELEPIIKYKMTDMEAKAYKIALIWQDECRRELPKEQFVKLKANADPRKSTLFKYCYKLAKEMKGILQDNEIHLYIRSQLQILKAIKEGEVHALIEPHCLVGEKAWKRWKLWRYRYRKKLERVLDSKEADISTKSSKVISEMKATYEFFEKRSLLEFKSMELNTDKMKTWIGNGEVSPFYAVLSPWMSRIFGDLDSLDFDKVYYRSSISPHAELFFKELFVHEYS